MSDGGASTPSAGSQTPNPFRLGVALAMSSAVIALSVIVSEAVPAAHVATVVAALFLSATWWAVWRADDASVEQAGLSLAGLLIPGPVDISKVGRSTVRSFVWALVAAAVTFPPFFFGYRLIVAQEAPFEFAWDASRVASAFFAQLVLVAFPEEAFFRGFVQTTFARQLTSRGWSLGAGHALAIVLASLVFAVGHFATIRHPGRLAVFFPSLLFGLLRSQTRGIGAGTLFHAACNVYSTELATAYGIAA